MARPHIFLESHKLNTKHIIYAFTFKEKVGAFNEKSYKTCKFMDLMKWDAVDSYIRNKYLPSNVSKIKSYAGIEKHLYETKVCLENLSLSIKLKPISDALLDVMHIKDTYQCYLDINVEELTSDTSASSINDARTPVKTRMGTPLPTRRRVTRRFFNKDEAPEDEYKPSHNNSSQEVVPEYIPSSSGVAMSVENEYMPESINGNSGDQGLQYKPSSVKETEGSAKRRSDALQSPILVPSTKKKRSDEDALHSSQESLAETLDSISIRGKTVHTRSSTDLFGPDSDGDAKDLEPSSSFELLQKKYESLGPVPGTSHAKTPKTRKKLAKLKKGNSGLMQQNMTKFLNSTDTPPPKPEKKTEPRKVSKSKAQKAREAAIAENIANMQQRISRLTAERDEIQQTSDLLEQQLKQQKEAPKYDTINFPKFSQEELDEKFEEYQTDIIHLFKSIKKNHKFQPSTIRQKVPSFVDSDVLDYMLDILHNNFGKTDINDFQHVSRDTVIMDLLLPEWVFMIYRDTFGFDDYEARHRIQCYSTVDEEDEEDYTML